MATSKEILLNRIKEEIALLDKQSKSSAHNFVVYGQEEEEQKAKTYHAQAQTMRKAEAVIESILD